MRKLLLLSTLTLGACTVWKDVPIRTGPSAATQADTVVLGESGIVDRSGVRVLLTNGAQLQYASVALHGDSLFGFHGRDSVGIARDSVRSVRARARSTGRTVAVGIVGAVAYGTLVWALSDRAPGSSGY